MPGSPDYPTPSAPPPLTFHSHYLLTSTHREVGRAAEWMRRRGYRASSECKARGFTATDQRAWSTRILARRSATTFGWDAKGE